jgi:hypothetical protein
MRLTALSPLLRPLLAELRAESGEPPDSIDVLEATKELTKLLHALFAGAKLNLPAEEAVALVDERLRGLQQSLSAGETNLNEE